MSLLACLAGCSTPRNPYYPDLEDRRSQEPLAPSKPDGFLQFLAAALNAVAAKNT